MEEKIEIFDDPILMILHEQQNQSPQKKKDNNK